MNEELIKTIIRFKLSSVERMLNKLPPEISNNLKNLGKVILESINESSQNIKNHPENKTKSTEMLNNIEIE